MWKCSVILLCLVMVVVASFTEGSEEQVLQKPEETLKDEKPLNRTDVNIRQLWKKCLQKFSYRCIKLALTKAVDLFPQTGLQIAPGITLLANSSRSLEMLRVLKSLLIAETMGGSEVIVLHRLKQFLSSMTVQVHLEDPGLLEQVKTLTEEVVDGLVATGESEGRKKGGGGALLWSAGALAAVGFASLAAVAGKAMMASLMALMLAGMTALRGGGASGNGGGGHKSSHVEIIKAPAHYELAPAHYEAGTHAFEHDHYYTAPSYEYGRMMAVSRPRVDPSDVYPATTYNPQ